MSGAASRRAGLAIRVVPARKPHTIFWRDRSPVRRRCPALEHHRADRLADPGQCSLYQQWRAQLLPGHQYRRELAPGASPLVYVGPGEGTSTNAAAGQLALTSLGSGGFTQVSNGTEDDFTFSLTPSVAKLLLGDGSTNGTVRIVITPGDPTVAATYAGVTNTTPQRLTLATGTAVAAVPEPGSIALIGAPFSVLACAGARSDVTRRSASLARAGRLSR